MSIKLDKKEIEKVNIYLDMIRQYNIEMQSVIQNDEQIQKLIQENQDFQKLDFTIQKTNESLRTFIGSVVAKKVLLFDLKMAQQKAFCAPRG